jgi:hypothetical protein
LVPIPDDHGSPASACWSSRTPHSPRSTTAYLTKLVVDAAAEVRAADGGTLTLTVDGTATALTPGATYAGAPALTVG